MARKWRLPEFLPPGIPLSSSISVQITHQGEQPRNQEAREAADRPAPGPAQQALATDATTQHTPRPAHRWRPQSSSGEIGERDGGPRRAANHIRSPMSVGDHQQAGPAGGVPCLSWPARRALPVGGQQPSPERFTQPATNAAEESPR